MPLILYQIELKSYEEAEVASHDEVQSLFTTSGAGAAQPRKSDLDTLDQGHKGHQIGNSVRHEEPTITNHMFG